MKRVISSTSNCVDVGCHKGEILEIICRLAPEGHHLAFEPIPALFKELKEKELSNVTVFPYALSEKNGITKFNYVRNAPAYSGIRKRAYTVAAPDVEEIKVETKRLDDLISSESEINFIKIDVEGGEFAVLKGAFNVLKRCLPTILFECGLGASDYYGTVPGDLFEFLHTQVGMNIFTLKGFVGNGSALKKSAFEELYLKNEEYYFVATARI